MTPRIAAGVAATITAALLAAPAPAQAAPSWRTIATTTATTNQWLSYTPPRTVNVRVDKHSSGRHYRAVATSKSGRRVPVEVRVVCRVKVKSIKHPWRDITVASRKSAGVASVGIKKSMIRRGCKAEAVAYANVGRRRAVAATAVIDLGKVKP